MIKYNISLWLYLKFDFVSYGFIELPQFSVTIFLAFKIIPLVEVVYWVSEKAAQYCFNMPQWFQNCVNATAKLCIEVSVEPMTWQTLAWQYEIHVCVCHTCLRVYAFAASVSFFCSIFFLVIVMHKKYKFCVDRMHINVSYYFGLFTSWLVLLNALIRLGTKLLSAMQNAWEYHCSDEEYKDLQGKPFKLGFLW